MHDSRRYRDSAAECLKAAKDASQPVRKLHLSMASSWLSLARQDEEMDKLRYAAERVKLLGLRSRHRVICRPGRAPP
jgi:hypothetical protein